jgi:hypothetical protein
MDEQNCLSEHQPKHHTWRQEARYRKNTYDVTEILQVRMQMALYWFLSRHTVKVRVANACLRLLRENEQDLLFEVFPVLFTTRAQLPWQS